MHKKQDGFVLIEAIMIVVAIIFIVGTGYFVLHSRDKNNPVKSAKVSGDSKAPATISRQEAFSKLQQAYESKTKTSLKDCPSFDKGCLSSVLSQNDRLPIAEAYGITSNPRDSLYFGLEKGESLDIGGIGTGYLNNKSKLMINSDEWYWEIGACSTNKRIFINADNGSSAGVHTWTYCSHNIDELSALN